MKDILGQTRSSFQPHHAFIGPDSHEATTLPNWGKTSLAFVIAPQMGARFAEYFANMADGDEGRPPLATSQRFFMVLEGTVTLDVDGTSHDMAYEDYAIIPPGLQHTITARGAARLIVLERPYIPLDGHAAPGLMISSIGSHEEIFMKGDERLLLRKLVPQTPSYDFEINTMEFRPGTGLPYVETHYMEHGVLLLNGTGIFRLEDRWYPAGAGDVIWMGPYCAQWFTAVGRENARYLIYKDYNRDPLTPGTYR